MLSVKLFVVNALIENLVDLLTYADHPLYADVYLDMLEHLTHLRRALLARCVALCFRIFAALCPVFPAQRFFAAL